MDKNIIYWYIQTFLDSAIHIALRAALIVFYPKSAQHKENLLGFKEEENEGTGLGHFYTGYWHFSF